MEEAEKTLSEKSEVESLMEENERLKHEIYEGRKVQKVIVEKIVPPRDYEQLQRRCQILLEQNQSYRNLIEFGSITTLERLVEQYITDSKSRIKKIASEASVSNFSKETTDEIIRLIKHLDGVRVHLHNLISIQSGGILLYQPKLRSIKNKAEEISSMIISLDTVQGMTDVRCDKLLQSLINMSNFLKDFLSDTETLSS